MAQTAKNPPSMRETWVRPLGWKDLWKEGMATQLQYSCLETHQGHRGLVGYSPWGHKELDTTEQLSIAIPPKYLKAMKIKQIYEIFGYKIIKMSKENHRSQKGPLVAASLQ